MRQSSGNHPADANNLTAGAAEVHQGTLEEDTADRQREIGSDYGSCTSFTGIWPSRLPETADFDTFESKIAAVGLRNAVDGAIGAQIGRLLSPPKARNTEHSVMQGEILCQN